MRCDFGQKAPISKSIVRIDRIIRSLARSEIGLRREPPDAMRSETGRSEQGSQRQSLNRSRHAFPWSNIAISALMVEQRTSRVEAEFSDPPDEQDVGGLF